MVSIVRLPATRWGAFFGHLLLSFAILVALSAFIALVMFPGALFTLAGGVEGIKIIAGVDMVLGPLLTLIIYNRSKPLNELARDLAIIFAIQLLALAAGMYLVHQSRPAAVVYTFDQFHVSKASEYDDEDGNSDGRPEGLHWFRPAYYNLTLAEDNDEARSQMVEYEFSGAMARLQADKFEALAKDAATVRAQLRLGMKQDEAIDDACIVRTLNSAFDTAEICFDPRTHAIRRLPASDQPAT